MPRRYIPVITALVTGIYLGWFLFTELPEVTWLTDDQSPASRLLIGLAFASPPLRASYWWSESSAIAADRLWILAGAGVQWLAAYFAGMWVLTVLGVMRWLHKSERWGMSLAIGLHVWSLWTLIVGLLGGLHRPLLFWLPMTALTLTGIARRVIHPRGDEGSSDRRAHAVNSASNRPSESPLPDWAIWIPRILIGLFCLVALLGGMLPPAEFDVREYHLQVPKEWFQQGYIDFLPHNVYGNMPLGAEMHALLAMVLWPGPDGWWWGALVGKTVMASAVPLTAYCLWTAGRRFCHEWAGLFAALLYVSTPWVMRIAALGHNENFVGLYLLLAGYLWWMSVQESSALRGRGAMLGGLFLGAAISCKYTGILLGGVPLTVATLVCARKSGRRSTGIVMAAALASSGPWFIKNAYLTGNPTYPLLVRLFDGKTRSEAKDEQWRRAHAVPTDARGTRFGWHPLTSALATSAGKSPWHSPFWIPLLVASLGFFRREPAVRPLVVLIVTAWLMWWSATHRIDRFLVPLLPWTAWLCGQTIVYICTLLHDTIGRDARKERWWMGTGMAVCLPLLWINWIVVTSPALAADIRFFTALAPLRRDPLRVNPVHLYINQHASEVRHVLLVGDAQPFDLEVPVTYNTCFDDCWLEILLRDRSAAERRTALRERGITHIYYHRAEVRRYQSPGNYGFTPFVSDGLFAELMEQGILSRWETGIDLRWGDLYRVASVDR